MDSAETLGSGVVIQVIGMLDINNGGFKRFMQTFVLAPQSHKNYYVYNDIFRYEADVQDQPGQQTQPPTKAVAPVAFAEANDAPPTLNGNANNGNGHHHHQPTPHPPPHQPTPPHDARPPKGTASVAVEWTGDASESGDWRRKASTEIAELTK